MAFVLVTGLLHSETLMNPHLSDVDVTASRHSFRSHAAIKLNSNNLLIYTQTLFRQGIQMVN